MRDNTTFHKTEEGTLTGTVVGMTLDDTAEGQRLMMQRLTNMYSDPKGATIREVATNAWDAHRAAGMPMPIEVHLPNAFSPMYVVQDHGTGMSREDLTGTYSKFGASTKRENDLETGMLGLGAKAPLTYTDQFTVESVKDGKRNVVLIDQDKRGVGRLTLKDEEDTDLPNGTKVTVPVPAEDHQTFSEEAKAFFRYWEDGSVLVNGAEPEPLNGMALDEDILLRKDRRGVIVVMGNVPYYVDTYQAPQGLRHLNYGVVARVPMGSVNFTPAREALHYTALTKDTLRTLDTYVRSTLAEVAQSKVAGASDKAEAFRLAVEVRDQYGVRGRDLVYDGETVPSSLPIEPEGRIWNRKARGGRYNKVTEETDAQTALVLSEAVRITGYTLRSLSTQHRDRIELLLEQEGLDPKVVILSEDHVGGDWLPQSDLTWDMVKAVKLPQAEGSTSGRPSRVGRYHVGGAWVDASDLDPEAKYLFYSPTDLRRPDTDWNLRRAVGEVGLDQDLLVRMGANRHAKFQREFPKARHLRDELLRRERRLRKAMTRVNRHDVQPWLDLAKAGAKDPLVQTVADLAAQVDWDVETRLRRTLNARNWLEYTYGSIHAGFDSDTLSLTVRHLEALYPALTYLLDEDQDMALEYVDALFATR